VRDQRPVYPDLLPPCNAGCPAGENIQAWLAETEAGRYEQAWRQLVADNPMPARAQMPAHAEEAEEAEREGVRINWLRTITAFDGPELTIEVTELGEDGFPRPTGQFETLAADTVILALGQHTDTGFLRVP
jgi:NADPH-dependent glutamate synthase beta subunit-like oxidoreductase